MKRAISAIIILSALATWQCSKVADDDRKLSLKESLENSIGKINTAADEISSSKGYPLLTVNEEAAKADDSFHDSIDLSLIAGIYDYQSQPVIQDHFYFPYRLFSRTGPSDKLIVNLPGRFIFHPKYLHFYTRTDSVLKNNFKITASDYHFYYNLWNDHDYKLEAGFSLDKANLGRMKILSTADPVSGSFLSSAYYFAEGYSVHRISRIGETSVISFALVEENDTLLMESILFNGYAFNRKESQYVVTIGDIAIKRTPGIDSLQVYLDGILQEKAAAKITGTEDFNASLFNRRDILLTFDDGTEVKLSELLDPQLDILKNVNKSLGDIYIARHVIDYIAFSIYYSSE